MIELRVITPDEWALWRELRLAALAGAPEAFGSSLANWAGDRDREERWRERLRLPGSYNLVAYLEGRPAGMAAGIEGEDADDKVVEVISMWVAPEARGRQIGDRLLQAIEAWAVTRGARTLQLAVSAGNDTAGRLYLRNGFTYTGELGDLMADGVRRERLMAKTL